MTELKNPVTPDERDEIRELLWVLVQPTPHTMKDQDGPLERSWSNDDHNITLIRKHDTVEAAVESEDTEILMREILDEDDVEGDAQIVGWRFIRETEGVIELRAGRAQLYTAFLSFVHEEDEEEEEVQT